YTALAILRGSRQGAKLLLTRRWQGLSWREQIEAVASLLHRCHPVRVLCDRTGVGDPLLEALHEAGILQAEGIVFTQTLKQNLIEHLALMLEQGKLQLLPDPTLLNELYHFVATPTERGTRLQGSVGVHDDLVIALALAAWGLPQTAASVIQTTGRRRIERG
ncbi:MAG: hypothetical protein ACK4P5_10650, partial [Fimbriimonadales bacterium]